MKKVQQNVGVKAVDISKGRIEVFNKNYFIDLGDYEIVWSLYKDGVMVQKGGNFVETDLSVAPRQRKLLTVPLDFASLDT